MEKNPSPAQSAPSQNPEVKKSSLFHRVKFGPKILLPVIFLVLIIAGGAGYVFLHSARNSSTSSPTLSAEPGNAVFNLKGATFATYKEIPSAVKPAIAAYSIQRSDIGNLADVATSAKLQFSDNQLQALEADGFFLQPTHPVASDPTTALDQRSGRSDDMVDLYGTIGGSTLPWERKPENAVFVSSDFLLHVFHVVIDRSFQKTEETYFQPALKQLTEVLYKDAVDHYAKETDAKLRESWKRLSVFYLVPLVLLDASQGKQKDYFTDAAEQDKALASDKDVDSAANVTKQLESFKPTAPAPVYDLATQELDLVMKADGFGIPSPLYGKLQPDIKEDYTQYKPRSHYTRSSVLRSYFRAMMWYGRHGFEVKNPDTTLDAVLMTWQLGADNVGSKKAAEIWEEIYLPTVFFVGRSDDLTLYEYSNILKNVYGDAADYKAITDLSKLQAFQTQAQKLPGPKILSDIAIFNPDTPPTKDQLLQSTKGFRFMGQRFIPDSYILSSFTQGDEKPDPETGQKLPSMPTALMVMSVFGSKTADGLLNDWVATNAPNSDKVIAKVKKQLITEFAAYDEKTWTQNIYWSWLYNLLPLFAEHTDGYPMFMRGLPWAKKSLLTAFGSWTELRHDTLLYAKQSFAEMGGGGDHPKPPPVPKGYVEPNLAVITRLIALATMTKDGLDSRGILDKSQKEKFESYLKSLQFFKSIAEKELTNETITDDEYEKLRTIIRLDYPNIVWTPDGDTMTEQDARVGIIADVHSDAITSQVLYEATGVPSVLYVAVKDKGGTRLTRGVAYTYYEFARPAGNRLTDEDWQGMLYDGKDSQNIPTTPSWENELTSQ